MRRGNLSTGSEVPRSFGCSSMHFARPARGEGSAAGAGGVCSDCRCCPGVPDDAGTLGAAEGQARSSHAFGLR